MATKKTAMQKYIDKALAEAVRKGGATVKDCDLSITVDVGESVLALCEAVSANARALEAAAKALSDHNTTMFHIGDKK